MELIRYPIAIRLRRSRREAISMRYVTSASTAHAPWNNTPATTTRLPGIGPIAARSQRSARVVSGALYRFDLRYSQTTTHQAWASHSRGEGNFSEADAWVLPCHRCLAAPAGRQNPARGMIRAVIVRAVDGEEF